MELARASANDIPAIVTLMNRAYRGRGADAGWARETDYIDGDRISEADLAAKLADHPDALQLVTRSDVGAIEGSVWLEPSRDGVWYLGALTIDPRLQNAGAGRRLLEAAERRAAAEGARVIRMKVVNVRETLIAWYERRGYRLTGESEPFPYDDTRFGVPLRDDLAFVLLEKAIAAPPSTSEERG